MEQAGNQHATAAPEPAQDLESTRNWWGLPFFLWLIVVPVLTVPWTYGLAKNLDPVRYPTPSHSWPAPLAPLLNDLRCTEAPVHWEGMWSAASFDRLCPTELALATLVPGALNLLPAFGLLLPRRRARKAALLAAGLGLSRWLVPAAIYLGSALVHGGLVAYYHNPITPEMPPAWSWLVSWALWGATFIFMIHVVSPSTMGFGQGRARS